MKYLELEESSELSESITEFILFLSVHSSSSIGLGDSSWSEETCPVDRFENSIRSGVCTEKESDIYVA